MLIDFRQIELLCGCFILFCLAFPEDSPNMPRDREIIFDGKFKTNKNRRIIKLKLDIKLKALLAEFLQELFK